jgi:hypothetical protein
MQKIIRNKIKYVIFDFVDLGITLVLLLLKIK